MYWETKNPRKEGKYIVKTKTKFGNIHVMQSYWNGKTWSVSNQIVTHYLCDSFDGGLIFKKQNE